MESSSFVSQEKDIERAALQIVNSNEQVHFKYRTITPQSTTDDSGKIQDQSALSHEDTATKKLMVQKTPALVDSSQKPSTTTGANGKAMRVTKRLRQGTGESNRMRSSHYEHMKEAAKSGQKQTYVPTIILN